jgi:hypothetical protein
MPEAYLFDRKLLKNKLILRKILDEHIGLDSDQIGKIRAVCLWLSQYQASMNVQKSQPVLMSFAQKQEIVTKVE